MLVKLFKKTTDYKQHFLFCMLLVMVFITFQQNYYIQYRIIFINSMVKKLKQTYVGIRGAGNACPPGLPGGIGGAPPPGLFGIAGACRPLPGGGGGTLVPPPNDPKIK